CPRPRPCCPPRRSSDRPRVVSVEQLGLSREIQSLCAEPEGLVLVTGPRAGGKSTLLSAFVDLINRTRSDHVITVESRVKVLHENRTALVSQRSEEHTSELQSRENLVCRLLLEKKKR